MKKCCAAALFCVLAMTILTGCKDEEKDTGKIGVVDIMAVYQESEPGVKAREYLEGLKNQLFENVSQLQQQAQESPDAEAALKIQQAYEEYQGILSTEQDRVFTILNEGFFKILEEYKAANGYAVILASDQVLSADKDADITKDVINAMNGLVLDIEPAVSVVPEVEAPDTSNATEQVAGNATNGTEPVMEEDLNATAPETESNATE